MIQTNQVPSMPVLASLEQATAFLDALLAGLYAHSAGAPAPQLIPIIDEPALARQILARPDIFAKNYAFLEDLGHGRFSSNGDDWRQRAALSKPWYRSAHKRQAPELIREIYSRHLAQPATPLNGPALFRCFTLAAVEVFSHTLNLPAMLPWPTEITDRMRAILKLRQWVAWNGCGSDDLQRVQSELAALRSQVRTLWQREPATQALLAQLQSDGGSIADFDATEELLQNVLASSEATASGLLWAAEALSQQPRLQSQLAQDATYLDRFITEVMRMFPPVPYLTRVCIATHATSDGQVWQAGSVLSISVVGMHRHPQHWRRPTEFDLMRPEFDGSATPFAYIPFSRGERVCAGMRLAQLEMRAAIEALLELRQCCPGTTPTRFGYGLASFPHTALLAHRR
jgi:cytochrome P450